MFCFVAEPQKCKTCNHKIIYCINHFVFHINSFELLSQTNDLQRDGVFVLRLVAANASYLVTSLVIKEIYQKMLENKLDAEEKAEEVKKPKRGSSPGPNDEGIDTLTGPGRRPMYPQPPGLNDFNTGNEPRESLLKNS